MTTPDTVDRRLLAMVAELGRVSVRDIATRLGLDPREAAARLAGLAAGGMPLNVIVDGDQAGLRAALRGDAAVRPPDGERTERHHPHSGGQRASGAAPSVARSGGTSAPDDPPTGPLRMPAAVAAPDVMRTWGPPQSAAWARGDQPTVQPDQSAANK